jgi:hypothetical protein
MDPSWIAAILGSSVLAAWLTATLGHRYEVDRAREERRQGRLADAYLQAIDASLRARDWVERTEPFIGRAGDPPPPEIPNDSEQRAITARLAAYGSADVQHAYWQVVAAFNAFTAAVEYRRSTLESYRQSQKRPDAATESASRWEAVESVRKEQVLPAVEHLLTLTNAELGERRASLQDRIRGWLRRPAGDQ